MSAEGGATTGPTKSYEPWKVRARFAAAALVLGLACRFALAVPVSPLFFVSVPVWFGATAAYFSWARGHAGSRLFPPTRFVVFGVEVAIASWVAHLLGAGAWVAAFSVAFPLLEWAHRYPGHWAVTGSTAALVMGGVLLAVGDLVPTPISSTLPGGASAGWEFPLAGYFLSACLLIGLAAMAGTQAAEGRLKASELEVANAHLHGAQAELVNSARLATLGMLASGVAHEINTPLGALKSNHDVASRALERLRHILEDEQVDASELEDVRRIVKAIDGVESTNGMAVKRMVQIVGSLRSFGRPDQSEIDRVDLHEGLESTLALLLHKLGEGVEVKREYGELQDVECHPNQINQVFMNLLVNAREAIPGEGTITIRTYSLDAGRVAVEVRDTGTGIAREDLDQIFEPGFTTKGPRMGMGLGLLISRQILERHGGRLEVESRVGEGTSFTVILPTELTRKDPMVGQESI